MIQFRHAVKHLKGLGARVRRAEGIGVRDGLAHLRMIHKTQVVRKGGRKAKTMPFRWTSRSGALLRSFRISWKPYDLQGTYYSDMRRAKIIEEGSGYLPGGVVRPRSAKMLAIPLGNHGWSPKDFPDLFRIKSKKGNILLVTSDNAGGIIPYFVLKKEVKIPARPTLERAERMTRTARVRIMEMSIQRAIRGTL